MSQSPSSTSRSSREIVVVMAVFDPSPVYLKEQIRSIAEQSDVAIRLVTVISDTTSGSLVEEACAAVDLDPILVVPPAPLDAVRAFEAGLQEVITNDIEGAYIALADQDDVWHSNRLSAGLSKLSHSGAAMVHSDARLVDADGRELHASMFRFEKRHTKPGLRGLLYRNNVTGMTTLMRRDVVEAALPFPRQSGVHFYHDLWLGLVAAALPGGVEFIDQALVDYRQHGKNTIGAVDRETKARGERLSLRMRARREAAAYGLARYLAHSLRASLTEAFRSGVLRADPAPLDSVRVYTRHHSLGVRHFVDALWLAVTGKWGLARIAAGHGAVAMGRLYWVLIRLVKDGFPNALRGFDEKLYSLSPGVAAPEIETLRIPDNKPKKAQDYIDKRVKCDWQPVFSASRPCVNVLVPTLNPSEMFAGITTALDMGIGLAARGVPVRFIATDLPIASTISSLHMLRGRIPLRYQKDIVSEYIDGVVCGVSQKAISLHANDRFLATAWWTAHIIDEIIADHGLHHGRFLYLIQDYEPNFYPWGAEFSGARSSYDLDFVPIFNTSLLRDYFAALEYDFAKPNALSFHPSIDISLYAHGERPEREGPIKLALYGRPEVARNMFETAIEALVLLIQESDWGPNDIHPVSVGLHHSPIELTNGVALKSLGKLAFEEYPDFLRRMDVGLSLMYSPHPSHPPIEMAASGMRVVTNNFGPKDLGKLSAAIESVEPTPKALAAAIKRACAGGVVQQSDREIDLTALGLSLDETLDALAASIKCDWAA